MAVRAKFKVARIERSTMLVKNPETGVYDRGEVQTIVLNPVGPSSGGQSSENDAFFAATPTGEIRLGTVNTQAAAEFELDGECYVTFERAAPPA